MSLQSLLAADTITVQQRAAAHQDASGGIASGGWAAVPGLTPTGTNAAGETYSGPFPARVEDMSSSQIMAYAMRSMVVDSTIYSQTNGIGMGHLVTTSDGKKRVVVGAKTSRTLGSIPQFNEYLTTEYRPGA